MTRSATATAICCSSRSPSASALRSARTARSPGSAATSSRSSSRGRDRERGRRSRRADRRRAARAVPARGDGRRRTGERRDRALPDHGAEVETLLQRADVAMYRAKETQTDVALYDERHDHHSPAKLALTAELRAAVEGERIVVWYQPELDLRTGEILAMEALVRWEHPRLGVLPPELVRPDRRADESDQAADPTCDRGGGRPGGRLARARARRRRCRQHLPADARRSRASPAR